MALVYGVDVSEHNGYVDWWAMRKAGITFALVRSGYGTSHIDKQFYNNMANAIAAGMKIGIYHFSYALDVAGAKKEAEFVLKLLKQYKDVVTLPVYFDLEYDSVSYAAKKGVTIGKNAFNNHAVSFCETIKAGGFTPGVYYNLDYYRKMVSESSLGGYSQWFAQYSKTPSISKDKYDLWQKSSSWTCDGNSGRFDYNEADASFLSGTKDKYTANTWYKDNYGWWYADSTTTYLKSTWKHIDGAWYYFNEKGYIIMNAFKAGADGKLYYCGPDGKMLTNCKVDMKIDADGVVTLNKVSGTGDEHASAYTEAIEWAKTNGVFRGDGKGNFDWHAPATREQIAQILYNLNKKA
jgi:GH25 family lysozyme M1 (1,4-beta-N-acetylmuramidase)